MRTQKLIIQLPQLEKYQNFEFGRCPRVCCQGQPVLPVGESDIPRTNTLKLFCPKCQDIYFPPLARHSSNLIGKSKTNKKKNMHFHFFFFPTDLDGAYFGRTFPHMLFQMYPESVPQKATSSYVPRIFGFKIHKTSTNYPKSKDKKK